MAIVSPGRMVVGWETISLIEGKRLKRGCRAVDQREGEREKQDRFHNLVLFSLLNYVTQRSSKWFERFGEITRLNDCAILSLSALLSWLTCTRFYLVGLLYGLFET